MRRQVIPTMTSATKQRLQRAANVAGELLFLVLLVAVAVLLLAL